MAFTVLSAIVLLDPFFVIDRDFLKSSWVWLSCIGFIIFLLVIRVRPALKRIMLVAAAGFTGMVLETILILYYQVTHGVLYQDIGILDDEFHGRSAAGAMAIHKKMSDSMEHRPFKRLKVRFVIDSVFYALIQESL